jgi:phosphocarrier protein HPr
MLEIKIKVSNQLGLHARAAAQLVRLAGTFQSTIELQRTDNGVSANAKSILSVLTLAASKGIELVIKADGADEKEAVRILEELFSGGFGEVQ